MPPGASPLLEESAVVSTSFFESVSGEPVGMTAKVAATASHAISEARTGGLTRSREGEKAYITAYGDTRVVVSWLSPLWVS